VMKTTKYGHFVRCWGSNVMCFHVPYAKDDRAAANQLTMQFRPDRRLRSSDWFGDSHECCREVALDGRVIERLPQIPRPSVQPNG